MNRLFFKYLPILFLTFLSFSALNVLGQTTVTVDFESAGDGYTPSATEGSGYTDVFNRSNPNIGGNSSFIWSVEDISLTNPFIDLDQIDITGATYFSFSIDMIAHHYNDWDNTDWLEINYSIDGGAYQPLIWVKNNGGTYNELPSLDTDFDGIGDCGSGTLPALTTGTSGCSTSSTIFATFSNNNISVSSNSTLDIRLQFNGLTATDEGIYLDNIIITHDGGATAPTGVTTGTAGSITAASAIITGNDVGGDGGDAITERGVVYRTSANPTTADNKQVESGTTGTFNATLSGLNSSTTYYARAFATNSVGTTYGSDVSFTTNAPAGDTDSDIIENSSFTYTDNVAYSSFVNSGPLTTANSFELTQFTIRDGGAGGDADAFTTTLTNLDLSITNHANLNRIAIFDGTTNVAEVASASSVSFSSLSLQAADNSTKDFSVRVSFQSTVTDNEQVGDTITAATAQAGASLFSAADAGGANSSATGDRNRIEVSASQLSFVQDATNVGVNAAMSPSPTVEAIDANSNRDLDFTSSVSITSSGTLSGSPVSENASSGLATFSSLTHTAAGTGLQLTASSTGLTDATSGSFDVSSIPTASDLIITAAFDGPLSGGTPKGIELYVVNTISDLSYFGVGSANNGGGSDGMEFQLSGSANAGDFIYVASENTEFSNWFGFARNFTSSAMGINGDDAIELFYDATPSSSGGEVVADVFGDINTDGSGEAWEYLDSWAYRNNGTGPNGSIWTIGNWSFGGVDALDGETTNSTATTAIPIGTYSHSPLPVELANFQAFEETNSVLLKWHTLSETNVDYFFVKRRIGDEEMMVGKVFGAGTSNFQNSYTLSDPMVPMNAIYELWEQDKNGNRAKLATQYFSKEDYPFQFTQYGNQLHFIHEGEEPISATIIGVSGNIIQQQMIVGEQVFLLPQPGVYFVTLSGVYSVKTEKVIYLR